MLAAVLALASSLSWGLSDFIGGLQSRRHPLFAVMVLSQGFALVLLVVAVAAGAATEHDTEATLWAVGSGFVGVIALTSFYRALAIGTMSIVAPLSATGAAVPVLVGLASGERPAAIQLVGIVLAMVGVMLAGREAGAPDAEARRTARASVALALLAALGFGTYFVGIDQAEQGADVAWVMLAARGPETLVLVAAFVLSRTRVPHDPATLAALGAVGFFDLLANLLFVIATGRGLLSVVGVLGALYPAVTVLLARAVLGERPTRTQDAGVLVTLAGVLAMAAGA
jgi:drug/metabolite transporter (DMT)-like permease